MDCSNGPPGDGGATLLRADPIPAQAAAVAAAKTYLRIGDAADDELLARLAATAIAHGERFVGQTLIARTMRQTLAADAGWRMLATGPVTAIAAVEALDTAGAATPLAVAAFAIDIDARGDGWVRTIDAGGAARVRVTFTVGLAADWSGLPEPIAQGIVRLAAHLFTHRDDAAEAAPPAAVAALWRPWRRMRL